MHVYKCMHAYSYYYNNKSKTNLLNYYITIIVSSHMNQRNFLWCLAVATEGSRYPKHIQSFFVNPFYLEILFGYACVEGF